VHKFRAHNLAMTNEYFIDLLNICGLSVWYLLHVAILVHIILRWLLNIWITCAQKLKKFIEIRIKKSFMPLQISTKAT